MSWSRRQSPHQNCFRENFETTSRRKRLQSFQRNFLTIFHFQGIKHRFAAIKTYLDANSRNRRQRYANDFAVWTLEEWQRVVFIDEFGFSTGDCGCPMVWRLNDTRYDERNIAFHAISSRKRVSFVVWYYFFELNKNKVHFFLYFSFIWHGIEVYDRFNKDVYVEYLEEVVKYMEDYFDDGNCLMLHDNHRSHTCDLTKEWVNNNIGNYDDFVLPHPP